MTRKDYIKIADAIIEAYEQPIALDNDLVREGINVARITISSALFSDNPRFQPEKFRDYITTRKPVIA